MQSVESVSIGHRRYRFGAFLFAQKDEREVTYYGMGIFSDRRRSGSFLVHLYEVFKRVYGNKVHNLHKSTFRETPRTVQKLRVLKNVEGNSELVSP